MSNKCAVPTCQMRGIKKMEFICEVMAVLGRYMREDIPSDTQKLLDRREKEWKKKPKKKKGEKK